MAILRTKDFKELSTLLGEEVFGNPVLKSTLDSFYPDDFTNISMACANVVKCCNKLVENHRNINSQFRNGNVAKGAENYQRLILFETARTIIKNLKIIRGLSVRLEVTGLNRPISHFFLTRLMKENKTENATHLMKVNFIHDERDFFMDILREGQIVDDITSRYIEEIFDRLPSEIPVKVLTPIDLLYPKRGVCLFPGQDEGVWEEQNPQDRFGDDLGSGSGAGGGGGLPSWNVHIDKGIGRWIVDGISDLIRFYSDISTTHWLTGGTHNLSDIVTLSSSGNGEGGTYEYFNNLGSGTAVVGGAIAGYGAITSNPIVATAGGVLAAAGAVITGTAEAGKLLGGGLGWIYCATFGCGSSGFVNE